MKRQSIARTLVALALMGIAVPVAAQSKEDDKVQEEKSQPPSIVTRIVYAPKDVGAPTVTVSGGVRGDGPTPTVRVLSPPTLTPVFDIQPTLYWFMTVQSPTPVRVTLIDEESTSSQPLLEAALGPLDQPGIYSFSLAEQGVALDRNALYSWSVALETPADSFSEQPVASTAFETVDQTPSFSNSDVLERTRQLTGQGYWYEAFDDISKSIRSDDTSAPWVEIRADLLDQVGLHEVATFERARIAQ